jgi:nucleoside-diphosphate-sugar epimerase
MKKALVAGALGVTGRTLINYLTSLGNWEVIGLSRRSPEFRTTAKFIAVDLLNRSEVETRLSAVMEMTDAELLAKAIVWAGENDSCDGHAFNITNGDFNRWENIWPRLAEFFKMEYGPPQHFPLAQFMSDKEPLWKALVKKYDLLDYSFQEAAAWPFGEAIFNLNYDVMSDTTKARRFGFHECVDTEEMLLRLFARFQKMRFIPS